MSDIWDLGETLREAQALDAPAPDASADTLLPPGEVQATAESQDETTDVVPTADAAPGGDVSADTGAGDEVENKEQTDETDRPVGGNPNFVKLREHATTLETELKATRAEIEDLGGMDLVKTISKPLLDADFNPSAVRTVIKENRGSDAYESLAWDFYKEHGDDYIAAALKFPNTIKSPELRASVTSFLEFQRTGGATITAPVAALPATSTDDFEEDDDDLPDPVKRKLSHLEAKQKEVEQSLAELNRLREQEAERQRIEREAGQKNLVATRTASLNTEITAVLDNNLSPIKFSTAIDPKIAEKENHDYKRELMTLIVADVDADANAQALYEKAYEKYAKGDRIGAREIVKSLKTRLNDVAQARIGAYSSRFSVKRNEETRVEGETRKILTGSGAAPTISPPEQQGGDIWDINRTIREARALG